LLDQKSKAIGEHTNNVAEYVALITGLKLAAEHGVSRLEIFMDSLLVAKQMSGEYKVKNAGLKPLWGKARELARTFEWVRYHPIGREANEEADRLANEAMDRLVSNALGPDDDPDGLFQD
jgi:ribonuclease HI